MLFLALLFTATAHASAPYPLKPLRLTTMSYNIKGIPNLILSGDYKNARYALIGKGLARRHAEGNGPAIVFLQEAFSENIKPLFKEAGYPHVSQGPPFKSFVGIDSGLYILSRYPIVAKAYKEFPQTACSGWDCFAAKGVHYARIEVPGLPRPLDVFNTHLQAGRDNPPARAKQIQLVLEFFRKHHVPGNPVIFGGDFNLRPVKNQEVYDTFLKGSGLANSGKHCLEKGCARSPDEGWQGVWENAVDHQFYASTAEVSLEPVSVERTHREPIDGFKLSDHLAHEVVFEFRVLTAGSRTDPHF